MLNGDKSEGEATCEAKNDIKEDDLMISLNAISSLTSHETWRYMATSRNRSSPYKITQN